MGRNGALNIEEWRPHWAPLWFHSTNVLRPSDLRNEPELALKVIISRLDTRIAHSGFRRTSRVTQWIQRVGKRLHSRRLVVVHLACRRTDLVPPRSHCWQHIGPLLSDPCRVPPVRFLPRNKQFFPQTHLHRWISPRNGKYCGLQTMSCKTHNECEKSQIVGL